MKRIHTLGTVAGIALVAAVVALTSSGCRPAAHNQNDIWPANHSGPKVVVSFAPLYCFAVNVAGDDAVVRNVMTTTGPHDFNPTETDVRLLTNADLMFTIGLGLDSNQTDLMANGSGNKKLKVIRLGERLPREMILEGECDHAHHGEKHVHPLDPHIWLSPDHAILMVNLIRDELSTVDPDHKAGYHERAAAYVARLEALKTEGLEMLEDKSDNRLVTFHDSLQYFANCFKLEIRDTITRSPGQEPDEKKLRTTIRKCTDESKPTRVIATEPQYSTSTSGETLLKELARNGVKDPVLVEIDPLETVQPSELTADWYEKRMRANLKALAENLR